MVRHLCITLGIQQYRCEALHGDQDGVVCEKNLGTEDARAVPIDQVIQPG